MGNLIQSETKSLKGPFILDNASLEAVHTTLEQVVAKLDEGLIAAIEEKAESIMESQQESGQPVSPKDKARQVVRERTLFKKMESTVELVSKDDKRLKDSSVLNILKDPKSGLLNPVKLYIKFQRGPCEFRMEVVSGADEGGVEIGILCGDDSINADIWHLVKGWLDITAPNVLLTLFARGAEAIAWILGLVLAFMLLLDLSPDSVSLENQYQDQLKDQAHLLLDGGIDSSEVDSALTTLLAIQSKYLPRDFVGEAESPAPGIQKNTILVGVSLLLTIATPRTIIGLGRRRNRAWLYKYWKAVVLVWLPVSILIPWLINQVF